MPFQKTSIPDATVKRPSMAFMVLAVIVFATILTVAQWLEKQRKNIVSEWERQERGQMALVVQKVARFSAPETFFPFILRQAIEMLRKNTQDFAFALLKPWNANVNFLFYSQDGKRIAVPGFAHEKIAVSEQVMAVLLRPESVTENRRNAMSAAFFGKRDGLANVAHKPEALIRLKGNDRFSHAGWWRLSNRLTPDLPGSFQIAHILVLIEADAFRSDRLLKDVLRSVRKSLPAYYRLSVRKGWLGNVDSSEQQIEEKARLRNGLTVALLRDPVPDKHYKQILSLWDFLAVSVKSFFMFLLAFGGKHLFTARRHEISLRRVIGIAILLAMVPVLGLFSQWCFDYMQTSTNNTVRLQHRVIERQLNDIDLGLVQNKASLEDMLNSLHNAFERQHGSADKAELATSQFGNTVDGIYLLDESGNVIERFCEVAEKKKASRDIATFLVTNLVSHIKNVSIKKSSDATFNLSYVRQLSRDIHQHLGKIININWAGFRRELYLKFVRGSMGSHDMKFLVALLDPDRLFRNYLAELAQKRMNMRFGVVEMTEGGPKSSMPDQLLLNTDLLMLSEEVWRLKRTIDRLIDLPGRGRHLVTGIHARHMGDVVLIGACPFRPIAERNHQILSFFILFVVFSFCSAILSALFISGSLGFSIKKVAKALERIRNHEFVSLLHAESSSEGRIYSGIRRAVHTLSEIYNAQPLRKKLVFEGTITAGRFSLESCFTPGRFLGGDYIEAMVIAENRLLFCIGEISGKPIPATLLIARIKMCISLSTSGIPDSRQLLINLNDYFVRDKKNEQQIRLVCAISDESGNLDIACAGHYAAILLSGSRTVCLHDDSAPLGSIQPPNISLRHLEMEPGESLFFVTSGCLQLFDQISSGSGLEKFRAELEAAPENWCSARLQEFWKSAELSDGADGSNADRSLAVLRRSF
ncbi:MAG: hypothetical protein CVV41_11715 [Candidatus Riflebacteria bacterium HGW-Riflebacteria-1]|jgi:hypothetical protein|nr:MAG: hypothetical protein CVV41_11715 [Candidatus Riflebacteria bacterium HGW-Riflebacteria-1]